MEMKNFKTIKIIFKLVKYGFTDLFYNESVDRRCSNYAE